MLLRGFSISLVIIAAVQLCNLYVSSRYKQNSKDNEGIPKNIIKTCIEKNM